MPLHARPTLSAFRRRLCAALACTLAPALLACGAHAGALPQDVALGMSVEQLRQAVDGARGVARPQRLRGGLVGSWAAAPVDVAGVATRATFYFAGGQLERIEYLADDASPAEQAFGQLLAWGRERWGAELPSSGPEGAYASWTHEGVDAFLQWSRAGQGAGVRLIIKRTVTKDASEL